MQQYDWLGTANQLWDLTPVGSHYAIVNVNSGKVLDLINTSTTNGATIQQWDWLQGLNQQWDLVPVAGRESRFSIVSAMSGKVLAVTHYSTANGGAIQQWEWVGGTNQQWLIVPVTASAGTIAADTGSGTNPSLGSPTLYTNKDYIYLNGQVVAVHH